MVKLNADMKAGTDAATVTDVQVNHVSQTIAKPNVGGSAVKQRVCCMICGHAVDTFEEYVKHFGEKHH